MIMECTDCERCADFAGGYRLFCLHPANYASKVCDYFPIGQTSARMCTFFKPGEPRRFTFDQLDEAEQYSTQAKGAVTYEGVREWILKRASQATKETEA